MKGLFYYFRNKKELYLFLWDKCAETTIEFLTKYECYEQKELFESMERGMKAKMEIIRRYPDMANFTVKAFYEKDADICLAIQESYQKYFHLKARKTQLNLDPEQFISNLDIEQMEKDFKKLLDFWKSIYLRKE